MAIFKLFFRLLFSFCFSRQACINFYEERKWAYLEKGNRWSTAVCELCFAARFLLALLFPSPRAVFLCVSLSCIPTVLSPLLLLCSLRSPSLGFLSSLTLSSLCFLLTVCSSSSLSSPLSCSALFFFFQPFFFCLSFVSHSRFSFLSSLSSLCFPPLPPVLPPSSSFYSQRKQTFSGNKVTAGVHGGVRHAPWLERLHC